MLLQTTFKFDWNTFDLSQRKVLIAFQESLIIAFNSEISSQYLKAFCEPRNLDSLLKTIAYLKSPAKATFIDLILTNQP